MSKPALHGYTKMPNWLFPRLPELSPAGMRVTMVILAESVGWGVEAVILSKADFMRLSGLARSSVQDDIKDALQQQVIERVPYQQGFAYRVKAPTDPTPFPWTSLRQALSPPEFLTAANPPSTPNCAATPDSQPPDVQTTTRPEVEPEGAEIQPSTRLEIRPEGADFQPGTRPVFGPEGADFQTGGPEFSLAGGRLSARRGAGIQPTCRL